MEKFKYELLAECDRNHNCIFSELLKDALNYEASEEDMEKWEGNLQNDDIIGIINYVKIVFDDGAKVVYIFHRKEKEEYAWTYDFGTPREDIMYGYKIHHCANGVKLYRMIPTKTYIQEEYCPESDRTFLVEVVMENGNIVSEEVIGFYAGEPNGECTKQYSENRKLKAEYSW